MKFSKLRPFLAQQFGRVPLQAALIVPFVAQLAVAVGIVSYLSYRNSQAAVSDLAVQLRQAVAVRVGQQIENYMEGPFLANGNNAEAFARGDIQTTPPRGHYLMFEQSKSLLESNLVYCASDADGSLVGVGREIETRNLELLVSNLETQRLLHYFLLDERGNPRERRRVGEAPYDARKRPWYRAAKAAGRPVWSPIYLEFDELLPTITASSPVYNSAGEFLGVCATDIVMAVELDRFLSRLQVGKTGEVFIVERSGKLVSSSTATEESLLVGEGETAQRLRAEDSQNPLVAATARHLRSHFGSLERVRDTALLEFSLDGARQLVEVMPLEDDRGLDWLIVVVVPEADFMGRIHRNTLLTVGVGLLATVGAIAVGILTSRWVVRPLRQLNEAADALARGRWTQPVAVDRGDEVGQLARSFARMAAELREAFDTLEARVRDRTAALEASNRETDRAREAAERANRAKGIFIANMSHELRSPLNAVLGFAQLLEGSKYLSASDREKLAIVRRSGNYLLGLINNLLDLSKLESGKVSVDRDIVDLDRWLQNLQEMFSAEACSRNLALEVERDCAVPRYFYGDDLKLSQVVVNLLSNAFKFTPSGTVVLRVMRPSPAEEAELLGLARTRAPNGSGPDAVAIQVEVEDTGSGIAPAELDALFEPFAQSREGRRHRERGTGLGLPISRQVARLMGGDLTLSSVKGQGTRARFWFAADPVADGGNLGDCGEVEPAPGGAELVLALEPGQVPPRVAIVDRDPATARRLTCLLDGAGFAVRTGSNGAAAAALAAHWPPDLWIVDPGARGLDRWRVCLNLPPAAAPAPDSPPADSLARSPGGPNGEGGPASGRVRVLRLVGGDGGAVPSGEPEDWLDRSLDDRALLAAIGRHLGLRYRTVVPAARPERPATDPAPQPDPAWLDTLPEAWADELFRRAVEADVGQVRAFLAAGPPLAPPLADFLDRCLYQYRFEAIVEFLETRRGPAPDRAPDRAPDPAISPTSR